MKRPLGYVALAYAGGLVMAEWFHPPLIPLFAGAFALLLAALLTRRFRPWLLLPLLILAGWCNSISRIAVISPFDIRSLQGESEAIVSVRGRLAATPEQRSYVRRNQKVGRSLARVELSSLRTKDGEWQRAIGSILVTTPGALPDEYFQDVEVEIEGVLGPPPEPVAEELFDYRAYLRRMGIYYQLKTESAVDWRNLSPGGRRPISDRFIGWAQATLARGLLEEDDALRLLWAMTLGWRSGLTNEVYEPFLLSGTMHIFAISGLHIALLSGIIVAVLRTLQLPRAGCGLIAIPLIWFYTGATGWQPSAIRSTIMMTIIIGGWALRRPSDLINSLTAAAFIILVWDPQQLFGASFQLSFFVVLSIAVLLPPIERWLDQRFKTDPFLPASLVPGWKSWLLSKGRAAAGALAISVAAWLGSLPLTAFYFHLFSWVTLLVNVLVVPLSSAALAANIGSLACGPVLPWVSELFNHCAWFLMKCMIWLSSEACRVPSGCVFLKSPGVLGVLGYLGMFAALWSFHLLTPRRRLVLGGASLVLSLGWLGHRYTADSVPTLTVLPVEGGAAILAHGKGGERDWVADPGRTNSVEFTVKPFLRSQGVNRLQALILTHGDVQHVGGANLVAQLFNPKVIVASPLRFRSTVYRQTLAAFERHPGLVRKLGKGDRLGAWTVLHPRPGERLARADDGALVLLRDIEGCRVLLLSELGRGGQDLLLERWPELRADIVVAGLPTGEEPLSEPLLDSLQPKTIVICDAEFPASARARPALKERLGRRKVPVFYTRDCGTVKISFRDGQWELRARFLNGAGRS